MSAFLFLHIQYSKLKDIKTGDTECSVHAKLNLKNRFVYFVASLFYFFKSKTHQTDFSTIHSFPETKILDFFILFYFLSYILVRKGQTFMWIFSGGHILCSCEYIKQQGVLVGQKWGFLSFLVINSCDRMLHCDSDVFLAIFGQ